MGDITGFGLRALDSLASAKGAGWCVRRRQGSLPGDEKTHACFWFWGWGWGITRKGD